MPSSPSFVMRTRMMIMSAIVLLAFTSPSTADADLFVTVHPSQPAEGTSYRAGETGTIELRLHNLGSSDAQEISVKVEQSGVSLKPPLGWNESEGGGLVAELPVIPAGSKSRFTFQTQIGGEDALIGGNASADFSIKVGDASAFAVRAVWPAGGCAADYHRALQLVQARDAGRLASALRSASKRQPGISGKFALKLPKGSGADRNALNAAARTAKRGFADPEVRTANMKWLTGRLTRDINTYLGQELKPSLCTGAQRWGDIMEKQAKQINDLVGRREKIVNRILPAVEASEMAAFEAMGEISPAPIGDAQSRLKRMMKTARLSVNVNAPGLFELTKVRLDTLAKFKPDDPRLPALQQAAALFERLWYLEGYRGTMAGVMGGLRTTVESVRAAHRDNCTCGIQAAAGLDNNSQTGTTQ